MKKYGLVKGRHELPSDCVGYVYDEIKNPMDFDEIELQACRFVTRFVERYPNETSLHIYVTGLTVALTSLIGEMAIAGFTGLHLWHYDKMSNDYKVQYIKI